MFQMNLLLPAVYMCSQPSVYFIESLFFHLNELYKYRNISFSNFELSSFLNYHFFFFFCVAKLLVTNNPKCKTSFNVNIICINYYTSHADNHYHTSIWVEHVSDFGKACNRMPSNSKYRYRIPEKCSIVESKSNTPRPTDIVVVLISGLLLIWVCVVWTLHVIVGRIESTRQVEDSSENEEEIPLAQLRSRSEEEDYHQQQQHLLQQQQGNLEPANPPLTPIHSPSAALVSGNSESANAVSVTPTTTNSETIMTAPRNSIMIEVDVRQYTQRIEVFIWTWIHRGDLLASALSVAVCSITSADLMEAGEYGKLSGSHGKRLAVGVLTMVLGFCFGFMDGYCSSSKELCETERTCSCGSSEST